MLRELIRLFNEFRKERREDILKMKLIRGWSKDKNFEYAAELFKIFTDSQSDCVMEITDGNIHVRFYRDMEGNVRQEKLTDDELFLGRRG